MSTASKLTHPTVKASTAPSKEVRYIASDGESDGIGAGAVIRSIMVGDPEYPNCKFIESVQTFENEEDFEEYDLATCAPSQIVTFGSTFDANGNEVGEWNPRAYATLKGNPIELEIKR